MNGWVNRIVASKRERGAQNSELTAKDAGVQNNQAADSARTPDAAYAAALTMLANEQASGRLDKDLAVAAAKSLGDVYREKHLGNSSAADGERSRKAVQAESTAYRIREELVGSGQNAAKNNLLSDLDQAVSDLLQHLTTVRKHSDIANRRNSGQPIQDQRLPSGWERAVIDSAAKIQAITSRMSGLAKAHAKAVSDYEATRH